MASGDPTENLAPSGGPGSPPAAHPAVFPDGPWRERYEPLRELGQGGMGRVLLVRSRADGSLACLKLLHPGTDRRSIHQECLALQKLRHPNIVSLLDFSFEGDSPWMATEFLEGETLENLVQRGGSIHAPLAVAILRQILTALEHAHSQDVIHRDLKPENIMIQLTAQGARVRLIDFGISIVEKLDYNDVITGAGSVQGTTRFMAPEQYEGRILTPACDLYAVALIAWEMLAGKHPFDENMARTMLRKLQAVDGLSIPDGQAPPALAAWIQAATRLHPAARPSASEALRTLDAAIY